MITSIYVSAEKVQVVFGKVSRRGVVIKKCASVYLPDGAVTNGVITNEDQLSNALEQLKQENSQIDFKKNVRLVLSSSLIYVKSVKMPYMKPKVIHKWLKGELTEIEGGDELIYDYIILDQIGKESINVLLCAAKKEFIESYIGLFLSLDIRINFIDTVQSSEIKLLSKFQDLKKKSFIMVTVGLNTLEATLYIEGSFRFSSHARLLGEKGTEEYIGEIERIISSLIQFSRTEHNSTEITHIFFANIEKSEEKFAKEIGATFGLDADIISDKKNIIVSEDSNFSFSEYTYAVGNLFGE